jgi:cell division protein FtsB
VSARTYRAVRRPAPRRTPRDGLPISRVHWDRLGRTLLVLVLFAVLASYVKPLMNYAGQWRTSHHERARLHRLEAENHRLKARYHALSKPRVLEREARKIGMVKQGERAYVIHGLSAAQRARK